MRRLASAPRIERLLVIVRPARAVRANLMRVAINPSEDGVERPQLPLPVLVSQAGDCVPGAQRRTKREMDGDEREVREW